MKLRYALLATVLLSTAASAQTTDRYVFPELIINSPAGIAATISNFDYAGLPRPPYTLPDTSASLLIGTNVFLYVNAEGDSVAVGVIHTPEGVTGDFVLALDAAGAPAIGCLDADGNGNDIANDISGQIVMIQRGVCPFTAKVRNAQAGGALAAIIYNPADRDPDVMNNLGGGAQGDNFTIPVAGLPWDIAEPIFNALAGGDVVNGTLRADQRDPNFDVIYNAGEGRPSVSGAGLFLAGQNPTSTTARLVVRTPAAETVSVIAYNMLGQQVAVLYRGAVVGEQAVTLQASSLPAGSYFVRAVGETFSQTQQITVVR